MLLLLAAAASAGDLTAALRRVDRDAARRLLSLAQRAESDGQRAAAALLFARVVELEPREAAARVRLGYRLVRDGWQRAPEQEAEVKARTDADAPRAELFKKQWTDVEERRTREIIEACVKEGTPEERLAVLSPMLDTLPDCAELRTALGHVRVGDLWVVPELAPAARMLPLRLQAWRGHAEDPVAVERSAFVLRLPGLDVHLALLAADGCDVASAPDLGSAPAEAVARVRGFVRFLLGQDAELWTPPPVAFLGAEPYGAVVRALHKDEKEFVLYHRFENYEHRDFYAIRVHGEADAKERYAHGAGYLTMYGLVAKGDERAHAWLLEGFGYLVSLELFDAGNLSYASIDESQAKASGAPAAPATRTRAACLAWVHGELRAGRGHPLEEIFSRSLNDLDLTASLQAWSFLRFLFLYDPDGAKRFPAALRDAEGATQVERTRAALSAAFGKDRAELERLWQLFPAPGAP